MTEVKIGDLGEKRIIKEVLMPLLNPAGNPDLPGDDCGIAWLRPNIPLLVSTDRVPWDLISFDLGLIDVRGVGYYLAILNLSDIAAMGGTPLGLVLNFALPSNFPVADLKALLNGVAAACAEYGCQVLGGDLSDASEPSISATVVGSTSSGQVLRRSGAGPEHRPYCTDTVGLTPTAFAYFREAKPKGFRLPQAQEQLLIEQFSRPRARVRLGQRLLMSNTPMTCMDNTDGLAQSLLELAEASALGFVLDPALIPLHEVTYAVAAFLALDPMSLALRPGADFQLVGSYAGPESPDSAVVPIGHAGGPSGTISILASNGVPSQFHVEGWNYFKRGPRTGATS